MKKETDGQCGHKLSRHAHGCIAQDCLVLRIARQAKQATQSDSSQLRPLPTLSPYFSMYLTLSTSLLLLSTLFLSALHTSTDTNTQIQRQ